jgi:ABC-type glycerol-3-phosphate transport system permease component
LQPGAIIGHAFIVVILLALLAPAGYAVLTSLQPRSAALSATPTLLFVPTIDNYVALFAQYDFLPYFINSLVSSLTATVIGLVIGVPAAYAMSRARFRAREGIVVSLLFVRALPAIGVAVPFFVLFTAAHLIDTLWALIIVYTPFCVGLVAWLMQSYFDSVHPSLDEAAALDGCTRLQTLVRVILPLSLPGLGATSIFAFLFGWNNFIYPLVLTQSRATTVPVALTQFVGEYTVNWGQIMAGVVVLSLPLVVFAFVFRRFMVSGLSQGAVRE